MTLKPQSTNYSTQVFNGTCLPDLTTNIYVYIQYVHNHFKWHIRMSSWLRLIIGLLCHCGYNKKKNIQWKVLDGSRPWLEENQHWRWGGNVWHLVDPSVRPDLLPLWTRPLCDNATRLPPFLTKVLITAATKGHCYVKTTIVTDPVFLLPFGFFSCDRTIFRIISMVCRKEFSVMMRIDACISFFNNNASWRQSPSYY